MWRLFWLLRFLSQAAAAFPAVLLEIFAEEAEQLARFAHLFILNIVQHALQLTLVALLTLFVNLPGKHHLLLPKAASTTTCTGKFRAISKARL